MEGWIWINVGGKTFMTTRTTLSSEPNSMLSRMFLDTKQGQGDDELQRIVPSVQDDQGAYMIDRSPKYFEPILNYLRTGKIIIDTNVSRDGVLEEARYFGIQSMVDQFENGSETLLATALTRKDVITAITSTESSKELRFQGVNLSGADLQMLDLRNINFKYAQMSKCNLSKCNLSMANLERANLEGAVLDGAQLTGSNFRSANLENASLQKCNAEDPSGSIAVFEGVNFRNANLEGANLNGANLRVSSLKYANAKNCDLRSAILAGADLEQCNLSGSDLNEANLRGSNLTNTVLESMLSPLHMSQTIR